jgi:nanoRNase/pAp phosphatase (c-di-AMP/oligoRNAs hydrolase)
MKAPSKTKDRLERFRQLLENVRSLLIVMQDNPDPDSIAAAVALRKLANTLTQTACTITCGGTVGRGENRALVRYLNLELHLPSEIQFDRYPVVALVDTQPGTGNNSLPAGRIPEIVIDHHPIKPLTRSARLVDIRKRYGATSTILFEYLTAAGIVPDTPLATALIYGIRSDTQDLGREATSVDIAAIEQLYTIANKRMLSEIQRGSVPREYFRMLSQALTHTTIYDDVAVAELQEVDNPDMIGEVADLLLREENTHWTLCGGLYDNRLLLSLRTDDTANRADKVMKRLVSRKGSGGGHLSYAGGQIAVVGKTKAQIALLRECIVKRLLKCLNKDTFGRDLI